jgi:hypothetical protein
MSESTVSEATATADETTDEPVTTGRLTLAQRRRLLRPLNEKRIKKNPKGFSYIPHNDSRAELIKTFGLCGYDLETLSVDQVAARTSESQYKKNEDGSPKYVYSYVFRATVRLTVKDEHGGTLAIYTASGAGGSTNQPSETDAVDNAIKGAESEAFKRCAINLGDQYGLSLYDDGALESVGGSLVDSPVLQAAAPTALPPIPVSQPTPAPVPAEAAPPRSFSRQAARTAAVDAKDNFDVLREAIRIVRSGEALGNVAKRVVSAHSRQLISDRERDELTALGVARRKELSPAPANA